MIEIVYARESLIRGFHETLDLVAREKIYIEMIEAKAFEDIYKYQMALIGKNAPVYYAVEGEKVVGWCDVTPMANPRLAHRATLGMGLRKEYRGKGLGRKLMEKALSHAKNLGLEKVELTVYTSNISACKLYEKMGFVDEGFIKNYRKLDGQSFDCRLMAKIF